MRHRKRAGIALGMLLCASLHAAEKPAEMPAKGADGLASPAPRKPDPKKTDPKKPDPKAAKPKPSTPPPNPPASPEPSPAPADATDSGDPPVPAPAASPPPQQRVTRMAEVQVAEPDAMEKLLNAQFSGLKVTWEERKEGKDRPASGARIVVLSGPEVEVEGALQLLREVDAAMVERQRNTGWVLYPIKQASPTDLQRIVQEMFPEVTVILGPQPAFLPGIPTFAVPTLTLDEDGHKVVQSQVDKEESGRVNQLILSGPRPAVERARELLDQVDVPVPQVYIEVTVIDTLEGFSRSLGINWDLAASGVNVPFRVGGDQGSEESGGILFGRLTTDEFTFNAQIQAGIQEDRLKLLANPKILAVNRRPAHIFIGDEINYAVSIQVTDKGTSVETERLRTGIQLAVFATASPDGTITLQLHPEVASLKQLVAVPGGAGVALPEISRRFTDSTVRLRAGETLVIGGLITENEQRSVRKVPLLGDLPLLGGLFRQSRKLRSSSEIIIFIKATSMLPTDPVREAKARNSPER